MVMTGPRGSRFAPLFLASCASFLGCASPPAEEPSTSAEVVYQVVEYKRVDEVVLNLHLWTPQESRPNELRPAVVFFFGGGWNGGQPSQFEPHCKRLAAAGFVACSAEYRVKSRHGTTPFECVKDGKSALRWLRRHAADYHVDPRRIHAGGGSAGGHVAACTGVIVGLEEEGEDLSISSRPDRMVLFNPVIDTGPQGFGHARLGERWEEISPLHQVHGDVPPTLIFHGTADRTVKYEQVEAFRDAMQQAGNPCTLVGFEGKDHGFFNEGRGDGLDYEQTVTQMLEFLTATE